MSKFPSSSEGSGFCPFTLSQFLVVSPTILVYGNWGKTHLQSFKTKIQNCSGKGSIYGRVTDNNEDNSNPQSAIQNACDTGFCRIYPLTFFFFFTWYPVVDSSQNQEPAKWTRFKKSRCETETSKMQKKAPGPEIMGKKDWRNKINTKVLAISIFLFLDETLVKRNIYTNILCLCN